MKKVASKRRDFDLPDGGTITRRRTDFLPDGAYFFEDELIVHGLLSTLIVTGSTWLLELLEIEEGTVFFTSNDRPVCPQSKRIGIFYAPFSIIRPSFENVRGCVCGLSAGGGRPPAELAEPFVFETSFAGAPAGLAQAAEILAAGANRQPIAAFPKASLLSLRAKKLIDENYLALPAIAGIAARLGVSPEHLARQFKRDFGFSPSAYLRQVRIADALPLLARGEQIISVSQMVGYNDLSRFYKQFRRTAQMSPGSCQTLLKPSDTGS